MLSFCIVRHGLAAPCGGLTNLLEHAPETRGKVTAGLPSLSPERRDYVTEYQLKQIFQRECETQVRTREKACVEPDGAIEDVTDWDEVVGIPLMGSTLAIRLKRLNPNLWFELSNCDHSKTGVYILKNDFKGGLEKEHICGMETDINPEFSVRVVNEKKQPKGIISGWRRLLMTLIRAKHVSESQVFALFGPPSRDSQNWARFTS